MIKNLSLSIALLVAISGCSSKKERTVPLVAIEKSLEDQSLKPYRYKYKPIIGSRHSDARVVIDQGVVLKAWINTYKIGKSTLVPSHDLYVRVKETDFIPQYAVPPMFKKRGLLESNNDKIPFMLSDGEIDRSSHETNEDIKNYVNSVYSKDNIKNENKTLERATEFDSTIKDFLETKTEQKTEPINIDEESNNFK